MRHSSLGHVVDRLVDGNVDDMRRDARGDDQVAETLFLEDGSGVLGRVDDAIDCQYCVSGSDLWSMIGTTYC